MLTRRNFALTFAGAGGALLAPMLAGCGLSPVSYRVRVTFEVDTPQGLKRGSSVWEISEQAQIFRTSETHAVSASLTGEAVAVDLPNGTLFALLDRTEGGQYLLQVVSDALAPIPAKFPGPEDYLAQVRRLGRAAPGEYKAEWPRFVMVDDGRGPVAKKNWPMFVTFRDIADPKSVERVDPDNLAAAFGQGVTLKRATLEITDEPITTGIEKRLGWLRGLNGHYLHGGATSREAPLGLHAGNFQMGE